jgi:hypothetical protein
MFFTDNNRILNQTGKRKIMNNMAKKDPTINEDIDRQAEAREVLPPGGDSSKGPGNQGEGFTRVKNASGSGLGSMGRNDQEQAGRETHLPSEKESE